MKKLWIGTWASLAAVLVVFSTIQTAQTADERVLSWFLQWRGNRQPPAEIVILAIDGESLEAGETILKEKMGTWAWKRAVYAEVIDRLFVAGAKAIALDILFSNPSVHGKEDDLQLQRALNRHSDRLVLAASYENSQNPQAAISQFITPQTNFQIPHTSIGVVKYEVNSLGQVSELNQGSSGTELGENRQIRSFAEATLIASGITSGKKLNLGKRETPKTTSEQTFEQTRGRINYVGFPGTWLNAAQQIPFFYVLDPVNWKVLEKQRFFANKIVLIGATADSLQDFQISPLGRMSGVEVNANAIATLLEDSAIKDGIDNLFWRAILVWGLIFGSGILSCKFQRPLWQFCTNLGLAIAWGFLVYLLFVSQRIILPVFLPIGAIVLQGLGLEIVGTLRIQRERSELRRTLEQYVAAPIVNEILSQPEAYRRLLQGKNVTAVVMFCDIRGFTTLCSKLPAAKLIAQLNSYLSEMVEAILHFQGTVDKFIGDEIMAEFGTPISQGNKSDALNSVKAALEMRSRLYNLRQRWKIAGDLPFYHGVGIHYGEITVGNIGSPKRLEYAAIGDTVNLASRVQGMTKQLGVDILITESVYELLQAELEVVDMGDHSVRGRSQPVRLYALVELKGNSDKLFEEIRSQTQTYLQPSPHVDGLSS